MTRSAVIRRRTFCDGTHRVSLQLFLRLWNCFRDALPAPTQGGSFQFKPAFSRSKYVDEAGVALGRQEHMEEPPGGTLDVVSIEQYNGYGIFLHLA